MAAEELLRNAVSGGTARSLPPSLQGNVLMHLVEACFVGMPRGIPRVAVETEGVAAGKASNASYVRQRRKEKGIREASSDFLPWVFTREKSRLGGNTEYDSDTELTSSLSADPRLQ